MSTVYQNKHRRTGRKRGGIGEGHHFISHDLSKVRMKTARRSPETYRATLCFHYCSEIKTRTAKRPVRARVHCFVAYFQQVSVPWLCGKSELLLNRTALFVDSLFPTAQQCRSITHRLSLSHNTLPASTARNRSYFDFHIPMSNVILVK